MARQRLLPAVLVLLVIGAFFGQVASAAAAPPSCTIIEIADQTCTIAGNVNGGGVTLSGHEGAPASDGSTSGAKSSKPTSTAPTCKSPLPAACPAFIVIPPGAPGNAAITIDDLKNFPATPGTDHMEPNGWMVTGLDTNFYSVVGVQIVDGVLLGRAASVRFTPIAWNWTYGDGAGATRGTPGATWAAQGIPEFDPTSTSHVYAADGTYYIDLSIQFRAEYRYSTGDWAPVVGTITLPANRLEATAGDAKTVLVNHDCTQNPGGPGCG